MGSRVSKVKSPYEILQVTPFHSLREIKLSYLRLSKISLNSELNNAYSLIKESPPPLSLYTTEDPDMIIEKINLYAKTNIPPLSSEEYKKAYRELSRLRNKEMSYHLDRLVRYWKSNDKRLIISDTKSNNESVTKSNNKSVNARKKEGPFFKCMDCNKEFKSVNTLQDHYKSKKHKEKSKITEFVIEREEVVQHKEVVDQKEDNVEYVCKEEDSKKETTFKKDHLVFRTCSHCKEVFDTRVLLLYHLRDKHK